jgi:hypothetical protein
LKGFVEKEDAAGVGFCFLSGVAVGPWFKFVKKVLLKSSVTGPLDVVAAGAVPTVVKLFELIGGFWFPVVENMPPPKAADFGLIANWPSCALVASREGCLADDRSNTEDESNAVGFDWLRIADLPEPTPGTEFDGPTTVASELFVVGEKGKVEGWANADPGAAEESPG